MDGQTPNLRIRAVSGGEVRAAGKMVLYWMTAFRRADWNHALDRAVHWARELRKPLAVVEPLLCGGRWDNDRRHRFAIQGMACNARRFRCQPAFYYPYVESSPGEATQLFNALAERSCVVIGDDFPAPTENRPDLHAAEAASLFFEAPLYVELVDSAGLLPVRAAEREYTLAHVFRRFLQRALPEHLLDAPSARPFARVELPVLENFPRALERRWPWASEGLLRGDPREWSRIPIDHAVRPTPIEGGTDAARIAIQKFLQERLSRYIADRARLDREASSGLSPYLHFGHISAHEIFHALAGREAWSPARLAERPTGRRDGFWGMSDEAEAFLDELVTWREIGLNLCTMRSDCATEAALPEWARKTLARHARDAREYVYSPAEFEAAETHDLLWNAAQLQLLREGRIHNYLRMLWGKKILEWSASTTEALATMIDLNNKYALDSCDPNSYAGILWVLGRYDRPWGPERPVLGTIRYMSSSSAARKTGWKSPEKT